MAGEDGGARPSLIDPRLGAILIVALVVRVGLVLATRDIQLVNDPADYQRLAVSVADGNGYGESTLAAGGGTSVYRAPGYPGFLGALYAVVGARVTVARLVQSVIGVGVVALIYALANRFYGRRTALVAAGIAALYPPLWLATSTLLTEAIFLPLELGLLLVAIKTRDRAGDPTALRLAALTGAIGGLAWLTRSVGLIVLLVAALLVVERTARSPWRALRPSLVVLAVAGLVVLPWTVRNLVNADTFIPVAPEDAVIWPGTYNDDARLAASPGEWRAPPVVPEYAPLFQDPSLDEVHLLEELREGGVRYMREHPGYVVEATAYNSVRLFSLNGLDYARKANRAVGYGPRLSDVSTIAYWLMGLAALAGLFTRARRRVPSALWLAPILIWLATAIALGTPRYRLPIEPFIVLLAAPALVSAWERVRPTGATEPPEPDARPASPPGRSR